MSKSDEPRVRRWLSVPLCIIVAALVWRFVDFQTTSIWIIAAITVPGILVILALIFIFASPSLEVEYGVISARPLFGKTTEMPISQIVSVRRTDQGARGETLVIRGLRDAEIVIDRTFDEDEIEAMLSALRAARPDLDIPTGVLGA